MTNLTNDTASSDTYLVEQSLAGNATAFGQLVEKHQSLVCALALGACGDLHRSEDLAQEAFVTAWRQLGDLREPGKFKAWICGIVRKVASSSMRKDQRTPTAQADEECGEETVADTETPAQQLIDSEERAILLRQLQELPSVYREPMVLFYRENESIASVAEALGISEDAVKQRLSRGREMLSERVERSLGTVLRTTAPNAAFTLAVMGALAAGTTTTSAATVAGAGSKLVNGTALSGTVAAPLLGVAAGLWSIFHSQTKSSRTPRESRFAIWVLTGLTVLGLVAGVAFGMHGIKMVEKSPSLVFFSMLAGVLAQLVAFAFGFWFYRRRQQIRLEDGMSHEAARAVWRMEPGDKGFWPSVIGFAVVLGSACNLPNILVVIHGGSSWIKTMVFGLPILLAGLAVGAMLLSPKEWRRILMVLMVLLFVQFVGLTGFFWQHWSQSKEVWQHFSAIVAIQSLNLGVWIIAVIGSYLYWRWENWGTNLR